MERKVLKERFLRNLPYFSLVPIFLFFIPFLKIPEVFLFASSSNGNVMQRLLSSPIHLSDDVMISLRAGEILNRTGIASLNTLDLAQPSTSYLSPYFFSVLLKVLPSNYAVIAYAIAGFLLTIFMLALILLKSESKFNAVVAIIMVLSTTTFRLYSAQGWDHVFQSAFILLAVHLSFSNKLDWSRASLIALSMILAVGFRPDGIILALCLIITIFIRFKEFSKTLYIFIVFCLSISIVVVSNYLNFGFFTPTTFRLKVGDNLSLHDSYMYLMDNLISWTAISLLILFFIVFLMYRSLFPAEISPLVIGCLGTGIYAIWVTDVFIGGRMFWSSSIVMCYLVCMCIPSPFKFHFKAAFNSKSKLEITRPSQKILSVILSLVFLVSPFGTLAAQRFDWLLRNESVIRDGNSSPTSSQFAITRLLNENFDPSDGAIGVYWLGISYHLPNFEIADFLGKGDELIANSNANWGPPGHNKWDTQATLDKWTPQLIIPPIKDMKSLSFDDSKRWISEKRPYAFTAELRLNKSISQRYTYCFLTENQNMFSKVDWGFYVRNDLVAHKIGIINCGR